ncbi:MAG: transcriptional regulator [Cytophagaceae bacterium SCN 52-12]|nr:MAG: transcriptional regulator [Cytophagaceae bacterium SCN 52-12]
MSERKKVHEGRNIKRFREMLGLKQEAFAWEMGEEWSQKRVSLLEQKESIDEAILKQVAEVLKVPVEAIQNFDDEMVVNIVTNTFSDFKDNSTASPVAMNYQCTFDPIDKLVQLHEEKIVLYERMLKEKDEMMEMLKIFAANLKG